MRTRMFFVISILLCAGISSAQTDDCSFDVPHDDNFFVTGISEYGQVAGTPDIVNDDVLVWDELNGFVFVGFTAHEVGAIVTKMNNRTQFVVYENSGGYDPILNPPKIWDSVRGLTDSPVAFAYNVNNNEEVAGIHVSTGEFRIVNIITGEVVFSTTDPMFTGAIEDVNDQFMINDNRDIAIQFGRDVFTNDGSLNYTKHDNVGGSILDMNKNAMVTGFGNPDSGFWWDPQTGYHGISEGWCMHVNDQGRITRINYGGYFDTATQQWVPVGQIDQTYAIANNGQMAGHLVGSQNQRVIATQLGERPNVTAVEQIVGAEVVVAAGARIQPGARIYLDIPFPPLFVNAEGTIGSAEIAEIPDGTYHARVVNPDGCGSSEIYEVTIARGEPVCGLLGIEAIPIVGLWLARRRRR